MLSSGSGTRYTTSVTLLSDLPSPSKTAVVECGYDTASGTSWLRRRLDQIVVGYNDLGIGSTVAQQQMRRIK
jgi:hypothetical protein